ncbi:MAG: FliO/MopB family protein [Desulfuromonadaceae bacterium]|nr:FliO/MopB family protein [Desulfuromonadaceae bacterium]
MFIRRFLGPLVLCPVPALAAEAQDLELFSMLFKTVAALAVVIGLVLLCYAFLRKSRRWFPSAAEQKIRILEIRHLGPKKVLYLIEVESQRLLLGSAGERLERLYSWTCTAGVANAEAVPASVAIEEMIGVKNDE